MSAENKNKVKSTFAHVSEKIRNANDYLLCRKRRKERKKESSEKAFGENAIKKSLLTKSALHFASGRFSLAWPT